MCRFLKEIKYFFLVSNTGVSNELQKASLCGPLSIDAVYRRFLKQPLTLLQHPSSRQQISRLRNAPAAAVQDKKQICDTLKKNIPREARIFRVESVSVTPVKGVYEVVAQNEIMYSDATADHIIVGQLFETKTQRNLTAETKDRLSRIDFTKLPLADAIKIVNGTGARQIAVFSDPNCSFCRKLEASLKEMRTSRFTRSFIR